MKMMYGGKPVKSMKAHVFDVNSNDATMIASDLQAGVSAYAKGKKVIGTGKAFAFAMYGSFRTNQPIPIPNTINVIEIASLEYSIQLTTSLTAMKDIDFSNECHIGNVIINGTEYNIKASVVGNILMISCDQNIYLQMFYGEDKYI